MKSIAKLKDDARKYEQKEEWDKAIQAYLQVLQIGEQGDGAELDLPLYNRVGDLYVRIGRQPDAVKYYEQAADRYAEAGLFNNAIALCNKALRYDNNRLELLRKLGSFSASQGFYTDARRWYLEFVEKSIRRASV
jgi:tetratricopeptide (TPR) repeat protein